jgi:putative transcriptional regulator
MTQISNNHDEYSLRDHFLIALPGMMDPAFAHSVTYICDHSPRGAMGVVINRPLDFNLDRVFAQLSLEGPETQADAAVLLGGPVHRERGFVLHTRSDRQWQSSLDVSEDISLTASRDIMEAIAAGTGPEQTQFILGYAGWEAGQLEAELAENGWLTVPADSGIIFKTPVEQRWHAAARQLGVDVNLIPAMAGHA